MKLCTAGLFLCLLLVPALTVPAQQLPPNAPTRQQLLDLIEAIQLRRTMEASQEAAMQNAVNVAQQMLSQGGRTPDTDTKRQMDVLMKGVIEDVRSLLPTDAMLEAVIPIYQRHLTSDEVKAIIAFQTSPVGKKMVSLQPVMMQETIQALAPLQQRALPELMRRLNERIQKLVPPGPAGVPQLK